MKKSILSIILCLSLVISSFAFAAVTFAAETGNAYYIDSINGNDSNDGASPESAWRTIKKANEFTYSEGDKILLKAGGIYTDSLVAHGNGTAENPITVSSYGNIEADGKPMIFINNDANLITLKSVKGWVIENLELSAPNGRGIRITAEDECGISGDITVRNCDLHDISRDRFAGNKWGDASCAPVVILSVGKNTRVDNVTLTGLNIYDCDYGYYSEGNTVEGTRSYFVSPEESYNQNIVIENSSFYNIAYDAIILRAVHNATVRNCSLIKASQLEDWYTAPMYMANVKKVLVDNCEIAGATNSKDGMAVDFDGWTSDSTYQYVYSHDNICFIRNCLYDDTTKNANCTVRYCLSVNDNKDTNSFAQILTSGAYDYTINDDLPTYMENFKFYNNTIINGSSFVMRSLSNALIANNIFCTEDITNTFYASRLTKNDDGKRFKQEFSGEFTNNCFYGYGVPPIAENSHKCDPRFVGTDLTDKNSFMLSDKSKLISEGIQVEEDMGEHDLYGNPLTDVHNIGCYEGSGEHTDSSKCFFKCIGDFFVRIAACVVGIYKRLAYFF